MPEPIPFQPGDTVRLRANPAQLLRVTAVDEHRGRWVCCAWKPAPDTWQHERCKPDELELVTAGQTAAEYLAACAGAA